MKNGATAIAYRGTVLHCLGDPGIAADADAIQLFEDGLLVVEDGKVADLGPAEALLQGRQAGVTVVDLSDRLIVPGFIDCHAHFAQLDIIGSYGAQLLDWLNGYAYPAEAKFADAEYARQAAEFFLDELLANGTTTAQVFATVHPQSVDAIFEAAESRNMRLIAGKVLMDSHCPAELRDDAISAYDDSRLLLERWHGRARLEYAITPRFAVTSSEDQLEAAGRLAAEFPGARVHTHLAENSDEIAALAKHFPWSRSYLEVYDRFGLVTDRSVFAHCLHIDSDDWRLLQRRGAAIAFCPTSNLFLGSGLFDLASATRHGIQVGIASDVGGGTTLNLLRTLGEAYKVLQLQGQSLSPYRALYMATLGAAKALRLDDYIGGFSPGMEADFIVLDPQATPLGRRRSAAASSVVERLFAMIAIGDQRFVAATYVAGSEVT